jgi:hypothetical protein
VHHGAQAVSRNPLGPAELVVVLVWLDCGHAAVEVRVPNYEQDEIGATVARVHDGIGAVGPAVEALSVIVWDIRGIAEVRASFGYRQPHVRGPVTAPPSIVCKTVGCEQLRYDRGERVKATMRSNASLKDIAVCSPGE